MPRTFSVEPAKSSRSKCKKCSEKIKKDSLRMGTHNESDDRQMTNWFHLKCFKKKIRKGPPTKKDITGFKSLSSSNKKKVLKYVFGDGSDDESDSSDSSSDDDDAPIIKKRTRKRKLSSDEESKNEQATKKRKLSIANMNDMNATELKAKCKEFGLKQSGKKAEIRERIKTHIQEQETKKQVKNSKQYQKDQKKCKEMIEDLKQNTVSVLKAMLAKNNVKRSGLKQEIIERVADCKMYGVYPKCPECGGGTLKVKYLNKYAHNGQGKWFCNGYMDDDEFVHCGFKSQEVFKRKKWID